MKKLVFILMLAACGETPAGNSCNVSNYDGLVGQNVQVLSQRSDANFTIIEYGDAWTGDSDAGQTIVFLDADDNILSFGCG